jgi:hypothetical protein
MVSTMTSANFLRRYLLPPPALKFVHKTFQHKTVISF